MSLEVIKLNTFARPNHNIAMGFNKKGNASDIKRIVIPIHKPALNFQMIKERIEMNENTIPVSITCLSDIFEFLNILKNKRKLRN